MRVWILVLVACAGLSWGVGSAQTSAAAGMEGLGGGGPIPGFLFLDLAELNQVLEAHGYAPLAGGMFLMGGGGFGGVVTGLRFGGLGLSGETRSSKGQKIAALSLGFGGFWLERGILARERYSVSLGVVIGGGGAELYLLHRRSDSFADAVENPPNTYLSREFFAVQTHIGAEFVLLDWIMLKVQVGYLWTLGEDWLQAGVPLAGPPRSLGGPVVQVMIALGGRGPLEEEPTPNE